MEENVLLDIVSTFKRPLRAEDPKGQPFGKVAGVVVAVVVVVSTVVVDLVVCNISSPIVKASPSSCLEDASEKILKKYDFFFFQHKRKNLKTQE